MPYGFISPDMEPALQSVIKGKAVYDLGAGSLGLSRRLIHLGAEHVYAVDQRLPASGCDQITTIEQRFAAGTPKGPYPVAFLSWPCNWHLDGLVDWLILAETVVYLGKNFDGNACGGPDLLRYLRYRELIDYIPHRSNNMIIVGKPLAAIRPPTPEEQAADLATIQDWHQWH